MYAYEFVASIFTLSARLLYIYKCNDVVSVLLSYYICACSMMFVFIFFDSSGFWSTFYYVCPRSTFNIVLCIRESFVAVHGRWSTI